jgi:hypothetical protein
MGVIPAKAGIQEIQQVNRHNNAENFGLRQPHNRFTKRIQFG